MKSKLVFLIFSGMILLSGCDNNLENRGNNKENTGNTDIPVINEDVLKDELLLSFDDFLNDKDNLGFLLSIYNAVSEIEFNELLKQFPSNYSVLISNDTEEYNELLKKDGDFLNQKIYKITKASLDQYLKEKTGYTFNEFSKNGISSITYMEKYDSYYTCSLYEDIKIDTLSVEVNQNIYTIIYKNTKNNMKYKLNLTKVDGKYWFVSNIIEN